MPIRLQKPRIPLHVLGTISLAMFVFFPGVSNAQWQPLVNVAFRKFEEPRIILCGPIIRKYPVVFGQACLVAAIIKESCKGARIRIS